MRVLGIDAGAGGALALLDTDRNTLDVRDMPVVLVNRRAQVNENLLAEDIRMMSPDRAILERVHAMPKQGVTSTFSFGLSYGVVRGVLAGLEVPFTLIEPREWKRVFHLGADKGQARQIAARLYPQTAAMFARVKDHGRAEAALLALSVTFIPSLQFVLDRPENPAPI